VKKVGVCIGCGGLTRIYLKTCLCEMCAAPVRTGGVPKIKYFAEDRGEE